MEGKYDLFLSYARGDDEPFVRRLYHDLTAEGFKVWRDREGMPSRAPHLSSGNAASAFLLSHHDKAVLAWSA
jgi:hypothetical protein